MDVVNQLLRDGAVLRARDAVDAVYLLGGAVESPSDSGSGGDLEHDDTLRRRSSEGALDDSLRLDVADTGLQESMAQEDFVDALQLDDAQVIGFDKKTVRATRDRSDPRRMKCSSVVKMRLAGREALSRDEWTGSASDLGASTGKLQMGFGERRAKAVGGRRRRKRRVQYALPASLVDPAVDMEWIRAHRTYITPRRVESALWMLLQPCRAQGAASHPCIRDAIAALASEDYTPSLGGTTSDADMAVSKAAIRGSAASTTVPGSHDTIEATALRAFFYPYISRLRRRQYSALRALRFVTADLRDWPANSCNPSLVVGSRRTRGTGWRY